MPGVFTSLGLERAGEEDLAFGVELERADGAADMSVQQEKNVRCWSSNKTAKENELAATEYSSALDGIMIPQHV